MERLFPEKVDIHTLSPLTLALIGDGVYELMVRERLVCEANRSAGDLHRLAVKVVRAEAQSAAMEKIEPLLTEQETAVYKRGRNAHTARTGKDYHRATGLETLFGYLYLKGELSRVRELFEICME
jgi:ribonuclease-3 family protein